jgi:23S rRNA (cytidine2498-2'-O)-methyltransferase
MPPGVTVFSPFAFAVCQPGSERWLKQEVAGLRPDLRGAFQRPGLVTFKAADGRFGPEEAPPAVFARAWACSAGPCDSRDAVLAVAARTGATHLWLGARDAGRSGEVAPALQAAVDADATAWEVAIRDAGTFEPEPPPPGAMVLDVITFPGEPAVAGWHVHGPDRHVGPCGRIDVPPEPAGVPSRAWRKVMESLAWSRADLEPGDLVLEIGAAPGGSTLAFLGRGVRVVALDVNPLDPAIAARPEVTWIRRPAGAVAWEEIPRDVAWIACDANIAPARALSAVGRFVPAFRSTLRGLLLTLKLNDDATVTALPRLLDRLRRMGAVSVRAGQLPAHRGDLFAFARMTPTGRPGPARRVGPAR